MTTLNAKADTTEKTAVIKDRFASPEYTDHQARLPRLQALRGEKGDVDCGYFVTQTEMEKAGWFNVKAKDLVTYEYNSGSQEQGLLIKSPKMLVVPRSPLFAFDRKASMEEKRMFVVGEYSRQLHGEREKYGLGQYYEVMLLDQNNEPLHETSFAYLAKGSNQASFNIHWQQLVNEVTRLHAIANQIPSRPKNEIFKALCVFQFTVKRELAGNNLKSPACKVDSHVSPNPDNWEKFFLGRNSTTADRFLNLLAPASPNMLTVPSMALPSAENEADDSISDAQLVSESPQSAGLEALKRSLTEKGNELGWSTTERREWAFLRHGCLPGSWTVQQWQEANNDLQELIDAHALPVLEASAS
jgi:hypothetical protein